MWNCGALIFWPETMPTPRAACTKTANSTNTVNHHSARVRSAGHRCAARPQRPAKPLPMMTTQAHPLWTSRRVASRGQAASGSGGGGLAGGFRRTGLSLGEGLGGNVDEVGDLLFGEPGQPAERLGQV